MAARCTLALCLGLATLGAVASLAPLPSQAQLDPAAQARRTPAPPPSPTPGCIVTATHQADPRRLVAGGELTATVRLRPACSVQVFPLHVALVLEATDAVDGRSMNAQLDGVQDLLGQLLNPERPYDEVGVVAFADQARLHCQLTADPAVMARCLKRVRTLKDRRHGERGRGQLERGIAEAHGLLRRARIGMDASSLRELLIVFTTGPEPDPCSGAMRTTNKVKADGILVMSVCMGPHCDAACVRQLASSARYYFALERLDALIRVFHPIRYETLRLSLKRLTLTYVPADAVRLVPDSADPAATVAPDGRRIDWDWRWVPGDGVTATLRLVLDSPGRQPLGREAGGTWLDNQNRPGTYVVPTAAAEAVAP